MSKKFRVIVADPPWKFSDKLKMSDVARGAAANYSVMTISDIKQLPVNDLADSSGAVLALWVPSSLLQEGLDTMKAWSFAHKQTYVWVKTKKSTTLTREIRKGVFELAKKVGRKALKLDGKPMTFRDFDFIMDATMLAFGMGRLFRQTHEICLIGTSNNKIYKSLANKSQRSVCFAENLKHSAKPEHLQDSLDIMFPKGNKLELFARRDRSGWTCLGNEVCNGEDIRISLSKL
jgi:N6-adenosine-specific RNA methylase IME4